MFSEPIGHKVDTIFKSLVAIGLVLNALATFIAIRSPLFENKQKWLQILVIWILPLGGGLLVWYFARDTLHRKMTASSDGQDGIDDGDIRLENYSNDNFGGGDTGGGDH